MPEISGLPVPWIFKPWQAPQQILNKYQIELGQHYPLPIVNHSEARDQALAAFQKIRRK